MPSNPAEYFQKNAQNNAIRLHISQTIIYSLKISRDLNIPLFDKSVNIFDCFNLLYHDLANIDIALDEKCCCIKA